MATGGQALPVGDLSSPLSGGAFGRLFAAIGRHDLQRELLMLFNEVCGADAVHLFWLDNGRPEVLGGSSLNGQGVAQNQAQHYMERSFWRADEQMGQGSRVALGQPMMFQLATCDSPTSDLRGFFRSQKLIERLMVCGPTAAGVAGFSVVRSDERQLTPADNQAGIGRAFASAFPIFAKHMEMVGQSRRLVEALTTLPLIEHCLALTGVNLPHRESQVAARLLYGLSASCIASDLGIGTETVNTHRKRLYERLGIGSHHELLLWYLKRYSQAAQSFTLPTIAAS